MQRCTNDEEVAEVIDFANLVIDNDDGSTECYHLSGESELDQKVFLLEPGMPDYGLMLKFERGDMCDYDAE